MVCKCTTGSERVKWAECEIGMEDLLFLTYKRTVFKFLFEESIKSFYLSTMYYTQSWKKLFNIMAVTKKFHNFECQIKIPIVFPVVTYFDIFFNYISFLDARSSALSLENINL